MTAIKWQIPDVDIDVKDREWVAGLFKNARAASQRNRGTLVRHVSGLYFQNIPLDPVSGFAAFPYNVAEELGYEKIDLLGNHAYDRISSMKQLDELLAKEVDWSWFKDGDFIKLLFHLSGHGTADIVVQYEPQSVLDLAVLAALIRPEKKHLVGRPWSVLREEMWKPPHNFKKSHAVSVGLVIVMDAQLKAPDYFKPA